MGEGTDYSTNVETVAGEITLALKSVQQTQIDAFISVLQKADMVFFVGVGRVRLALEMMVKRLNHVGVTSCVVGAVNEPPIHRGDLLVIGSGSGESLYPLHIAQCARHYGAGLIHLTSSPASSIAKLADVVVDFHCGSKRAKGAHQSIQPMTTLFEQCLVVFGDLVCLQIMANKGLSFADVSRNHANLE